MLAAWRCALAPRATVMAMPAIVVIAVVAITWTVMRNLPGPAGPDASRG